MDVKLRRLSEDSEEAKLLALVMKYYDYNSDPDDSPEYWQRVHDQGRTICDRYEGTELRKIALQLTLGAMDAIEAKYKLRKEQNYGKKDICMD